LTLKKTMQDEKYKHVLDFLRRFTFFT
jgi:hypothetical protein